MRHLFSNYSQYSVYLIEIPLEGHYHLHKFSVIPNFLKLLKPGLVVHTCNPSTQKGESGGSLVQSQLGL
jgi:hypothetical protein